MLENVITRNSNNNNAAKTVITIIAIGNDYTEPDEISLVVRKNGGAVRKSWEKNSFSRVGAPVPRRHDAATHSCRPAHDDTRVFPVHFSFHFSERGRVYQVGKKKNEKKRKEIIHYKCLGAPNDNNNTTLTDIYIIHVSTGRRTVSEPSRSK